MLELTQAQVSRIERGITPTNDLAKLDRWARQLRVPQRCLWFTLSAEASDAYANAPSLLNLEEVPDDEGSDVRRRDLFKAVGVAAAAGSGVLADTPWQRLADSLAGRRPVDATSIQLMEDRTAEFFREEESVPARQLLAAMHQHREALTSLRDRTRTDEHRSRLMTAIGETDALIGWLLFDLGHTRNAETTWRRALSTARDTGDGPLAACALGYWSYLASARGDAVPAVDLLKRAANHVAGSSSPATRAWIAARESEERASLGDDIGTLRALERAVTAFDFARPRAERPWTAFFNASRLGSLTVSAYTTLGHREAEPAANALLSSLSLTDTKVRAIVLADVTVAAVQSRDYDRAETLASQALPLVERTETRIAKGKLIDLADALATGTGTAKRLSDQLTNGLLRPSAGQLN